MIKYSFINAGDLMPGIELLAEEIGVEVVKRSPDVACFDCY